MSIGSEIKDWLYSRPNWQQEAALRILEKGQLSSEDIDEITAISKTTEGQASSKKRTFPELGKSTNNESVLRLISIGNIEGIDNLAPRKPLEFRSGNLTVVYGNNGSGKSGYTRILKKVCGKSNAVDLKSNVFKPRPIKQCCNILYELEGEKCEQVWDASEAPLLDLTDVNIFDSTCGTFYLQKENEVSYKPEILALFDKLVQACDAVNAKLKSERDNLPSKLPIFPIEYIGTIAAVKYINLNSMQTETMLDDILIWDKKKQLILDKLNERLKTDDPRGLARRKRTQKTQVDNLYLNLSTSINKLSIDAYIELKTLKKLANTTRKVAEDGAKVILESVPLAGVGSATWRALWEAARSFSETEAYKDIKFPNTQKDAYCVLCQQELSSSGQKRLTSFEAYIQGTLSSAAITAEKKWDKAIEELPEVPKKEVIQTALEAAGLDQKEWLHKLQNAWDSIAKTILDIKKDTETGDTGQQQEIYPWLTELKDLANGLEQQALQHDIDSEKFDREQAIADRKEVLAKKWTVSQASTIKVELKRLKKVADYDIWIGNTNSRNISTYAGSLAETMITEAYVKRFNQELQNLGAHRVKVKLQKTRASKGHILHALVLNGIHSGKQSLGNVLSDGELKVVALAAFISDVTGNTNNAPFIFDDPISSLDQDYEEKTIDRIITLSENHQVIIFTHRLSFVGILESKASLHTVCITREPWGDGEPGDIPIFGKNPVGSLKNLLNDRLKRAENVLNAEGSKAYYPLAKAICSDFRIIVERIVELVFLADVIQRHRRDVKTKGKLEKLLKIKESDCEMIDNLMSRYSSFEHSQSVEAPVDVPPPEELRRDIESLLIWHDEFKGRKNK